MNKIIKVRNLLHSDERNIFNLLKKAFRNLDDRALDDIHKIIKSDDFVPEASFVALENNDIVGFVRTKRLRNTGRYEIWDLAVLKDYWEVASILLENVLSYMSRVRAYLIRAHTLPIDPYVSTYIKYGFKPVRRILRIDWNLENKLPELQINNTVSIKEASEYSSETIAKLFVESIKPYWNWWIEDYGGDRELIKIVGDWFQYGIWLVAEIDDKPIGITGVIPSEKDPLHGIFQGVMVHPEYRMMRVGSTLMNKILKTIIGLGFKTLSVYTVAFLDRLAPGAILYLKSGGKIIREYIHLEKRIYHDILT